MPTRSQLPESERDLYSKLRKLLREPGLLRGNLVQMRRTCGKKSCHCHTDPDTKHVSLYLGVSIEGKHKMIYVPAHWEQRVRTWVERYSQARELLQEISAANLKRLQNRKD
jgi:hypothetical protein